MPKLYLSYFESTKWQTHYCNPVRPRALSLSNIDSKPNTDSGHRRKYDLTLDQSFQLLSVHAPTHPPAHSVSPAPLASIFPWSDSHHGGDGQWHGSKPKRARHHEVQGQISRSYMCETHSLPRCQETWAHTIDCLGASGINLLDQAVLAALSGIARFFQTHAAGEAIKFNEISSAWLEPVWIFFFILGCYMRTDK